MTFETPVVIVLIAKSRMKRFLSLKIYLNVVTKVDLLLDDATTSYVEGMHASNEGAPACIRGLK